MHKGFKFKIYLSDTQKEFMVNSFGCTRFVYNYFLSLKINNYNQGIKVPTYNETSKLLTNMKATHEYDFLNYVERQSLNQSLQNLENAYSNFFKRMKKGINGKKAGFPNFKSKHTSKQSCTFLQNIHVDFERNKIKLPKLGWIDVTLDRTFNGKIKKATVVRNSINEYYVSILVDTFQEIQSKSPITNENSIGIDVGIKTFLTTSEGKFINNPKFYENDQIKLLFLQQNLSRKKKGSKNREKAKYLVAKHHKKIMNRRNDFLHKLTSKLISENKTIFIEDLDIKRMLQNHNLAKSIMSVSWGEFYRQLIYKGEWYGSSIIKIGRFQASSKTCSCGVVNKNLNLSHRKWTCLTCGVTHDRDLLAANNIKKFGLEKL